MLKKAIIQDEIKRLPKLIDEDIKKYQKTGLINYLQDALDGAQQLEVYQFILTAKNKDWE